MLAVVVVNYGSSALVDSNLGATVDDAAPAHVVVVDNYSTPGERDRITALCARRGWELIAPADNTGFGAGMNAGVRRALELGASELLLLNPDARIDGASIDALRAAVAGPGRTMASPIVRSPDGRVWFGGLDLYLADGTIRGIRRREDFPGAQRIEWLSGACLWITRDVWELVEGFDDDFFLYWEDVDLSARLLAAGGEVVVVPDAVAWHDEGSTHKGAGQRAEAKSETYYYYNIRNRMLFAARHLDDVGIRAWRRTSLRAAKAILLRGGRRQFL
ncbi:MAG TPA: glycosyltransferase family 2 protein, partial [Microbacterium sp.]|nr:glycosyltransferase family 2 protein [Microbacterium sp.]